LHLSRFEAAEAKAALRRFRSYSVAAKAQPRGQPRKPHASHCNAAPAGGSRHSCRAHCRRPARLTLPLRYGKAARPLILELLNEKEFRVALDLDRRSLMGLSAAGVAAPMMPKPARANATALGALGIDVTHFGVTPGSQDDQSEVLQRAIDAAAAARVPLWLP